MPKFKLTQCPTSRHFERDGGGLAAANAKRRRAAFQAVFLQGRKQRHDDSRARRADRMAERAGAALVMPAVGIDAMNKHLAEICQCGCVSAIALLIRAGAGWLGSPQLIVRDNIVLMPLPPTALELDSVDPLAGCTAVLFI